MPAFPMLLLSLLLASPAYECDLCAGEILIGLLVGTIALHTVSLLEGVFSREECFEVDRLILVCRQYHFRRWLCRRRDDAVLRLQVLALARILWIKSSRLMLDGGTGAGTW